MRLCGENMSPTNHRKKKVKLIVDCPQEIPCNPCARTCGTGAISIEGEMCGKPRVEDELCSGCLKCLDACPVSCIYLIEESGGEALLTLAYDRLPLPRRGESVALKDRNGKALGRGKVERAAKSRKDGSLAIITLRVPAETAPMVRSIIVGERNFGLTKPDLAEQGAEMEEVDFPICRCEETSSMSLRELIGGVGIRHAPNLRRISRVGLGLCQGRSCTELLLMALREEAGCGPEEVGLPRSRVPVRPVSLEELCGLKRRDDGHSER